MQVEGYMPRIADEELQTALSTFGAVLIEGPKWCGKTTTARRAASSELLVADPANDFGNRVLAELDPAFAMRGEEPRLIDEWQEVPKLWDAARFACDERGGAGHFIFTGSATPRESQAPMHSGAGRFARLKMGTMTLFELGRSTGEVSMSGLLAGERYRAVGSLDVESIAELIVRGGWPGAVGLTTDQAASMAREYLATIAGADISSIDGVRRDPQRVRALLRSLARNESTLASTRAIAADLQNEVSRPTVGRYLSLLARLHVIDDIPAWYPAVRSPVPLRESAKHHFADPSLAAAALGADVGALTSDVKTLGLLFESLVLHDLGVYAQACGAELGHYHDYNDLEVDAIVSKPDGTWAAFEAKLGSSQVPEATESLNKLERIMVEAGNQPPAAKCVVIGFGMPAHVTVDGVQVVPIDTLGV